MSRQLDAVYEHGVFRPLKPLAPPEHQHVRLTIEETPGSPSPDEPSPSVDRRAELE